MNTVLDAQKLNKSYTLGKGNEQPVLRDVDMQIKEGEFISVMGPSGSGKSTLLYNICGMDRPDSGTVLFQNRDIAGLPERELSRLRLNEMGFIFQQIHLLKNLSIFDNIILSGYQARTRSRMEVNRRAEELMERTGITELAGNDITQASGGQLQRVGICRALINEPGILFGDEPTGALNSSASEEIMALLAEINRAGTTIMLVTHDIKVASRTERVLFMMDGRIVAEKRLGAAGAAAEQVTATAATAAAAKAREEHLAAWLLEQGF
ncbi:MAG: ABC transporter ATP-binding protein [Spirochaetaceae bacterium]|nr:MAG: ABC transporter ATP-binding protein [Spirochaetaceae bacterium]